MGRFARSYNWGEGEDLGRLFHESPLIMYIPAWAISLTCPTLSLKSSGLASHQFPQSLSSEGKLIIDLAQGDDLGDG